MSLLFFSLYIPNNNASGYYFWTTKVAEHSKKFSITCFWFLIKAHVYTSCKTVILDLDILTNEIKKIVIKNGENNTNMKVKSFLKLYKFMNCR